MLLGHLSDSSKVLFLELELSLANIDGEYSESEQQLVLRQCNEMGIEPIEYDPEIVLDDVIDKIRDNMSVEDKKIIFLELLMMAVIDGVYDSREKEFVESLRKVLGIPETVSDQAFDLIKSLVEASQAIEDFVEW